MDDSMSMYTFNEIFDIYVFAVYMCNICHWFRVKYIW